MLVSPPLIVDRPAKHCTDSEYDSRPRHIATSLCYLHDATFFLHVSLILILVVYRRSQFLPFTQVYGVAYLNVQISKFVCFSQISFLMIDVKECFCSVIHPKEVCTVFQYPLMGTNSIICFSHQFVILSVGSQFAVILIWHFLLLHHRQTLRGIHVVIQVSKMEKQRT